jgi:uncharacterized protein YukJ
LAKSAKQKITDEEVQNKKLQESVFQLLINGSTKSRNIAMSIVADAWNYDLVQSKLQELDYDLQRQAIRNKTKEVNRTKTILAPTNTYV